MWYLILLLFTTIVATKRTTISSQSAEEGQFPYQVSIQVHLGYKWEHDCSGTILTDYLIITSASCYKCTIFRCRIVTTMDSNTQYFKISGYQIVHKRLLILELFGKISFDKNVTSVNLPNKDDCLQQNYTVSGWVLQNGYSSRELKKLQFATVPLLTTEECNRRLSLLDNTKKVSNSTICTESSEVHHHLSVSDTGAPLVKKNMSVYTLYGILKWTLNPHWNHSYPMAFISICPYIDILKKIITPIESNQQSGNNKTIEEENGDYELKINGTNVEITKENNTHVNTGKDVTVTIIEKNTNGSQEIDSTTENVNKTIRKDQGDYELKINGTNDEITKEKNVTVPIIEKNANVSREIETTEKVNKTIEVTTETVITSTINSTV